MSRYTKESLDILRQKVDLVDVLRSHLQLKKAGGSYKALCPFHDEKSPSFVVQSGDTHYHCFGCGAHGDAIQFLMQHLRMTFSDAVAHLADRFSVVLEAQDAKEEKGVSRSRLKEALDAAVGFFQHYLLYSEEGVVAVRYLMKRGLDLPFIQAFQIGLAPRQEGLLQSFLRSKRFTDEEMIEAGLFAVRGGQVRDFFQERITFPIHDATGSCIGFSARKIRDEVFGGKYINTRETPLFKKSKVLFGLHHSRKRIAKEGHAIIVEGQLDALQLIYHGFDYTVASLGTAFGEDHVRELQRLGATRVYLLFDGDKAGREAAIKTGHHFQKAGIEVMVAVVDSDMDPDLLLAKEGPCAITRELLASKEYLAFLIHELSQKYNPQSPAEKQKIVDEVKAKVAEWTNSVMVHESLKKAARILGLPEDLVGLDLPQRGAVAKQSAVVTPLKSIDPNRILETDLLRWLIVCRDMLPEMLHVVQKNLSIDDFKEPLSQMVYKEILQKAEEGKPFDLVECAPQAEAEEFSDYLSLILNKKVNREKARDLFVNTIQKIKERNWMQERELIKVKIHSGMAGDDEVLALARRFDELKKSPPKVVL